MTKRSSLIICIGLLSALNLTLAQAQTSYTEVVLHNFVAPPKGAYPDSSLIRDAAGNLYGT